MLYANGFIVSDFNSNYDKPQLTYSAYNLAIIQQQQQYSILSQANWGRLEMKPKIHKDHGSGTLIASLQALLSKVTSSEISQSLRSLLTDSSQVSLGLPLPLFTLSTHFRITR